MAFTAKLTGVVKIGTGELTLPISASVTTIEEWLQIRELVTGNKILGQGGLTSIDFCYLQFIDATTLLPTHVQVLPLTDIVVAFQPLIVGAAHTTEFLYINSTGTSALGIEVTPVVNCYAVGILAGAA